MSEEVSIVEEPQPNPYNAKKSWDAGEEHSRGLLGPDEALFKETPEASNKDVSATSETPEEVEVNKFSKVDYKKRYDDMKRHYDQKLVEWKAKRVELETVITSSAPQVIPKTPEELATFKEQYPDVYDVVESVAATQAQAQLEKVNRDIDELRKREFEISIREAQVKLEKLHPDFHAIANSEDFIEWTSIQPKVIQEWITENPTDASLAARAIDLYKKDKGILSDTQNKPKKKKPTKKADAAEAVLIKDAVDPSGGEKKIWTTSEIDNLSIQQYEEHKDEIDLAFKEKRIVRG